MEKSEGRKRLSELCKKDGRCDEEGRGEEVEKRGDILLRERRENDRRE